LLPSARDGRQVRQDEGATLAEIEFEALQSALSRSKGNVTRAAGFLGVSRDTLRYRIQKFGLQRGLNH
jgi:two-component system, NtrC family, response regulator AtoC